jgi:hypothetical protein
MFPIIDKFIPESIDFLSKLQTPEEVAEGCIKLLKGNGINRLSSHEFTHWLDQAKGYLETALKVDQKSPAVRNLLNAELKNRKRDVQIAVFIQYGKISDGRVIEQPQIRMLPWHRIAQMIIPWKGKENWDEHATIADIIDRKENFDIDLDNRPFTNPYMLVKRFFNAPAPEQFYVIRTQQEADALTSYLARLRVFLWNEEKNCELRSQAACEYLEGFNVDPRQLYFVRVGIQHQFEESTSTNRLADGRWCYHQAIAIKTATGETFVLDPLTNPEKALSKEEWASQYGKNLTVNESPALVDPKESEASLKKWTSEWNLGKYDNHQSYHAITAFAVARGEKLPQLQEIIPKSYPLLKSITENYESEN